MTADRVDKLILEAIQQGVFPGACYTISRHGKVVRNALGRFTYCPEDPPTTLDTIWDLASVSKVVGTTTAAMILYEEGGLDLDRPVAEVLTEFGQNGKDKVTPRNLLVHNSGLVAFRPYHLKYKNPEEVLAAIYAEVLTYPTGAKSIYSDLSMIVVAKMIERLVGKTLDAYLSERVFQPLGMNDTTYRPQPDRCAPTEAVEPWRQSLPGRSRGHWIQGEVHDPTACVLGGVAGHAGLFATLGDLERFMAFMVNGGFVKRSTIEYFTRKDSEVSTRALGWDTKSPQGSSAGTLFGPRSYGHTGYTGTSIWCEPDREIWAILLTNRVHPIADNIQIIDFRPRFHDTALSSL